MPDLRSLENDLFPA